MEEFPGGFFDDVFPTELINVSISCDDSISGGF